MNEGWNFVQRHDGLWTLFSPVGRPMLDVAFRPDLPLAVRDTLMNQMIMSLNVIPSEEMGVNPLHTPV